MRNHFCDLINRDHGLSVEEEAKNVRYGACYKNCLSYVIEEQVGFSIFLHNGLYDESDTVC